MGTLHETAPPTAEQALEKCLDVEHCHPSSDTRYPLSLNGRDTAHSKGEMQALLATGGHGSTALPEEPPKDHGSNHVQRASTTENKPLGIGEHIELHAKSDHDAGSTAHGSPMMSPNSIFLLDLNPEDSIGNHHDEPLDKQRLATISEAALGIPENIPAKEGTCPVTSNGTVERHTHDSTLEQALSSTTEATIEMDSESPAQTSSSPSSSTEEDPFELETTPLTSTSASECDRNETEQLVTISASRIGDLVAEIYSENIIAKAVRTAQVALKAVPAAFPEIVPQEDGHDGSYSLREAEFWTCGFFPGTLYGIFERFVKFPQSINIADSRISKRHLRNQLKTLCCSWSEPLHGMAGRTDTHDIGFIVMPALRLDWELTGNQRSLESIIRAARSLATRYVSSAKAIRSWDLLKKKDIEILDQEENMIVIIDSLCNLDLLYYASHHAEDPSLAEMASKHATTLLRSHLRPEEVSSKPKNCYRGQWFSTCHVANIDPRTGSLKQRLTAQGYDHESTWSRGQAWGIMGYAQTYMWTKDRKFLEASCGLAEYFLHRLETAPECIRTETGRYVPLWDFDAPLQDENMPLRDSSAGIIAANGMLVLSQALEGLNQRVLASHFRTAALNIVQDTILFAMATEKTRLILDPYEHIRAEEMVPTSRYDGMLKFGTANNNANARKRYANHGLVYGDYYLVEFGNQLLRMGLE